MITYNRILEALVYSSGKIFVRLQYEEGFENLKFINADEFYDWWSDC